MKKIIFLAAFAILGLTAVQSQNMKLGASLSLPVGDSSDSHNFGAQVDFAYLFDINDAFHLGPMASLLYYNGDKIDIGHGLGSVDVDDFLYLPVGGEARFLLEEFFFGADLGYAIGLSPSGNDGGFFYRPKVGYDFRSIGVVLSYSGIAANGGTFGSVNAGVEFSL